MDDQEKIKAYINSFGDWRSKRLEELREIISGASPELKEAFKWNVPVWSSNGLVCAISGHKEYVKINLFKGALLNDSKKLFNSGLDSKEHRSINISKDTVIDKVAIYDLINQAIRFNTKP